MFWALTKLWSRHKLFKVAEYLCCTAYTHLRRIQGSSESIQRPETMKPVALALAVAIAVAGSGYLPQQAKQLIPDAALTEFSKLAGDLPLQQVNLSVNILAGVASLLLLAYALLPSKPRVYVVDFAVHAHDPR